MSKNLFLIEMLTSKMGLEVAEAETFISVMFKVVNEGLREDKLVKIKGLGTFKLTKVSARESVDVNTGERIVIEGRDKISFTPDNYMRDLVNSPFAQFETVVLNDGVDFSAIDEKYVLNELEDNSSLLLFNEDSLEPSADESKNILSSIEEVKETLAQFNEIEEKTVDAPILTTEIETNKLLVVEQEESKEDVKGQVSAPFSFQLSPQQLSDLNAIESNSGSEEKAEVSENSYVTIEKESVQLEEKPQLIVKTEEKEENGTSEEGSEEVEDIEESTSRSYVKPLLFSFLLILCLAVGLGVGYYSFQHQSKEIAVTQLSQTTNKVVVPAKKITNPTEVVVDSSQKKQVAVMVDSITKKNTQAVVVKTEKPKLKEEKPAFNSKQYNRDPRVRTGAYIIIGVEKEIEVKSGQTLYSLSQRYLGPDMECYVEAINGKKNFEAGEKIKIPILKLKKKKHIKKKE